MDTELIEVALNVKEMRERSVAIAEASAKGMKRTHDRKEVLTQMLTALGALKMAEACLLEQAEEYGFKLEVYFGKFEMPKQKGPKLQVVPTDDDPPPKAC